MFYNYIFPFKISYSINERYKLIKASYLKSNNKVRATQRQYREGIEEGQFHR